MLRPSKIRNDALGPAETFSCAPYMRQEQVEAALYQNSEITTDNYFAPIDAAAEYAERAADGDSAIVKQATIAMRGMHKVIVERSQPRAILLEVHHQAQWEEPHVQTLRSVIFSMIGSTQENPQLVRDDRANGEPYGNIIAKGQSGPNSPLYLVERMTNTGSRRLVLFDGRLPNMADVMTKVNEFSPNERRLALTYLSKRTMTAEVQTNIMAHANRYTTPDADALYGAFQYEAYGKGAPSTWGPEYMIYGSRKGEIPQ